MRHVFKTSLIGLGAVVAVVAAAPDAFAGCGVTSVQPATWDGGSIAGRLTPANLGVAGIVGMWSFTTLMSDGTAGDWGYQQWHSDGTEIINSGSHAPAGGNFCLGTWRQTGPNTYHLVHFPLAYNPATNLLMFRIVVTEDVTVVGNRFTGPTTLKFYNPAGTTLLFTQTGQLTGQRVLPN